MMEKKKMIVNVGASKDSFGAYAENMDGIWAGFVTISTSPSYVV